MFVEDLVLWKDILDVLKNRCLSLGGRLSCENKKPTVATSCLYKS